MRLAVAALIASAAAAPAIAVGLGPLTKSGNALGDRKGFYLTLINPYPAPVRFRLYAVDWDSEAVVAAVRIPIATPVLGANSRRKVLVIATDLKRGEDRRFRVCAERAKPEEGMIHARVCSKLIARRVA